MNEPNFTGRLEISRNIPIGAHDELTVVRLEIFAQEHGHLAHRSLTIACVYDDGVLTRM